MPAKRIYIVAREHACLYDALCAQFAGDPQVRIVIDRRWVSPPLLPARGDEPRRGVEVVDSDLHWYGWALVVN